MNETLKKRNEVILALYLAIFSLIKPILVNMPEKSTIILGITTVILIGSWILLEWWCEKKNYNIIKVLFIYNCYFRWHSKVCPCV